MLVEPDGKFDGVWIYKTRIIELTQITLLYKYSTEKLNFLMPEDKLNMAKNIDTSIAGLVGGAKGADKLHIGNGGHIATSISGNLEANVTLHYLENREEIGPPNTSDFVNTRFYILI